MVRALLPFLLLSALARVAPAQPLTLEQKAALFQYDMEARFLFDGQALCKLKLPAPQRDFPAYNMPDNAYMTGMYLGALSMKYAVTGADADRMAARGSLQALHLLATVSGKPGLLARAAWPVDRPMDDDGEWRISADGRYRWRGDVSTDQMDGVFFGLSLAHDLIADEADRALIAADAAALADHVLENGLRIIDADGEPTTWGKYNPQYARLLEPMNTILLLQLLKVAHHVTGEARFGEAYRTWAIDKGYARTALRARRSLAPTVPGAVNHSDDVLLFLAYEPLLRLETDPELRTAYLESFRRSWEGAGRFPGMKPEANPLYSFLAAKYLDDPSQVAPGIDTLRWFSLDIKWNRDTIARYEQQFHFTFDPAVCSPEPAPKAPVPIDRREKTWSAWVQDPYNSAGNRSNEEPIEYNGHDYLLAYWMGRHLGFIRAGE